jgi:hypothetical protein
VLNCQPASDLGVSCMTKESRRGHHYVPRSYLKRFAAGKKKRLHVQEVENGCLVRTFHPNIPSFLVECGIYDLGPYLLHSPSFHGTEEGFLEDIVFARVHEPLFDKKLKATIDLNLLPDTHASKGIIQGVWTLYLRSRRVRQINIHIAQTIDQEIDEARRRFLSNFGMVTAKTIIKLLPTTLAHTKSILLNAVGETRFLTTDNPSIPCYYNEHDNSILECDQIQLQRSVILADEWPFEVALLCPLSPRWCILTWSVRNLSSTEYRPIGSGQTATINQFIQMSADRFIILPPE